MTIDSTARAFIDANIDHYRGVTLAVKAFEGEVEATLRSIWREFKQQLIAVGIPADDPSFGAKTEEHASQMYLGSGWSTGIEVGIALQSRDDNDELGRIAVYSWVWVKNPNLRKSLDNHVAAHASAPFVHEFEDSTTYLTAYMDVGKESQAIDWLRDGFRALFGCLVGSPEFCKSYNVSGPADMGSGHR